jgi:hypothetical protein
VYFHLKFSSNKWDINRSDSGAALSSSTAFFVIVWTNLVLSIIFGTKPSPFSLRSFDFDLMRC